jgi:hypothetical protein
MTDRIIRTGRCASSSRAEENFPVRAGSRSLSLRATSAADHTFWEIQNGVREADFGAQEVRKRNGSKLSKQHAQAAWNPPG